MTLYACFNPDGSRITTYNDDLINYPSGTIPSTAIIISQADQDLYCTGNYVRDMTTGGPTSGQPIPAPPRPLVEADYINAAQELLDSTAQARNYDSMLSLATYLGSSNATFKAESEAGVTWRDAVWTAGYALLSQIQAGTTPAPTLPAFLAALPAMVWPS